MTKISKKDAIRVLWERGCLEYKLHPAQKDLYASLKSNTDKIQTVACSRRLGKSFLLLTMANEICIQNPNSIIKYVCPTKEQVRNTIVPLMRQITEDCPPDLRPQLKVKDYKFVFPNGSQIHMAGSDNGNHESIRGGSAQLCIVDEAGFCSDLGYVVKSILLPTTLTTKGRVILVSTPSKTPDHEFVTDYMMPAKYEERLIIKTIYDNPLITQEDIDDIVKGYPLGLQDSHFRREYLCEVITDTESSVIPEFTEEVQNEIVRQWDKPPMCDYYVSMDPGFKDLTAVLFAYYDFKKDRVVIEDEIVINGPSMTTDVLAQAIKNKEEELFKDMITHEVMKPLRRVSDINLILLNDLQNIHNLTFIPTMKDDKAAAINNMRMLVAQGKIIINPRCKTLINHMKGATWNNKRTSYNRSPDNGHYDCIDALVYLLRNISFGKNPYPANWGVNTDGRFFSHEKQVDVSGFGNLMKKTFRIK